MTALLIQQQDGLPLVHCLPPIPAGAALDSTFVASLDLGCDATLDMHEVAALGPIILGPR